MACLTDDEMTVYYLGDFEENAVSVIIIYKRVLHHRSRKNLTDAYAHYCN